MDEIIVLGQIPGTQIQITFAVWLIAAGALTSLIMMRAGYRTQLFRGWLIAVSIARNTQRKQF